MSVVVVGSVVMYMVGITLAYKASRNPFSILMFVLYIWGFVLIGGINYYIIEGHSLTPIVVGLSSIALGLGSRFSSLAAMFNPKRDLRNITPQQLSIGVANKTAFRLALGISLVLALFAAFIILRNSPLFNPEVLKIELVRPGMGPLMRLVKTGLPILSIMYLLIAMRSNKFSNWIFVGLVMGITVVALMLTGYKGFVLWFAVLVVIALSYLKPRSRQLKLTVAILLILGLAAGLAVLYLTPNPGQGSFRRSLNVLWKRMTVEQTLGLDYVLYNLVPKHGFYYGLTMIWDFTRTVNDLTQGLIFPNPHPSLTNHLSNLIIGRQGPYAVTTMIMGDLYANWGLLGVLVGCFLYGFILEIIYIATLRMRRKTIIFFPFWLYSNWIFVQMASTGAPIAFFLSGVASLFMIYVLIIFSYTYFHFPFINQRQILKGEVGIIHAET